MRAWISLHLRNAVYTVRDVANGLHAGFDMIKILNSERALKDVPVIFLTVDEARRNRGSEVGAVEYLTKPIEVEALLKVVEDHLR